MPRMRVDPKVNCAACRHYRKEGIWPRCIFEDNKYTNWLGIAYKQIPSHKNYNGKCRNYEETKGDDGWQY